MFRCRLSEGAPLCIRRFLILDHPCVLSCRSSPLELNGRGSSGILYHTQVARSRTSHDRDSDVIHRSGRIGTAIGIVAPSQHEFVGTGRDLYFLRDSLPRVLTTQSATSIQRNPAFRQRRGVKAARGRRRSSQFLGKRHEGNAQVVRVRISATVAEPVEANLIDSRFIECKHLGSIYHCRSISGIGMGNTVVIRNIERVRAAVVDRGAIAPGIGQIAVDEDPLVAVLKIIGEGHGSRVLDGSEVEGLDLAISTCTITTQEEYIRRILRQGIYRNEILLGRADEIFVCRHEVRSRVLLNTEFPECAILFIPNEGSSERREVINHQACGVGAVGDVVHAYVRDMNGVVRRGIGIRRLAVESDNQILSCMLGQVKRNRLTARRRGDIVKCVIVILTPAFEYLPCLAVVSGIEDDELMVVLHAALHRHE